tara:strand:+ start:304 stop:525 length:222 start_codon:yes stop_codon:yes gene_type:complete
MNYNISRGRWGSNEHNGQKISNVLLHEPMSVETSSKLMVISLADYSRRCGHLALPVKGRMLGLWSEVNGQNGG